MGTEHYMTLGKQHCLALGFGAMNTALPFLLLDKVHCKIPSFEIKKETLCDTLIFINERRGIFILNKERGDHFIWYKECRDPFI